MHHEREKAARYTPRCFDRLFEGYRNRWNEAQKDRAANIDTQADQIIYCSHTPSKGAFLQRNRYMVDQSHYCIAYCNRNTGGHRLHPPLRAAKGACYPKPFPALKGNSSKFSYVSLLQRIIYFSLYAPDNIKQHLMAQKVIIL